MSLVDFALLPLALAFWTAIWLVRRKCSDPSVQLDLVCLLAVELLFLVPARTTWRPDHVCLACHVALHCGLYVISNVSPWNIQPNVDLHRPARDALVLEPWAKPTVIPSRTNHVRLIPRKHAFSYRYLLVGIPVGWSGRCGYWLSCDSRKKALLSVCGSDHLQRNGSHQTLRQKLDTYIKSEGGNPSDYPLVYLVTAPRVLGYSFNPVSFWYLYSADRRLVAMILEVNNTFDERRPYFLRPEPLATDESKDASGRTFSTTWPKDFHVSPFNDRTGLYRLLAQEPGLSASSVVNNISNTITLMTTEKDPKLVARIFSGHAPLDASTISLRTSLWLVASYGWVGFVTFPRILREAWKLYFKRALEVWFRPEVGRGSIGRTPTNVERTIERVFRGYLEAQTQRVEKSVLVLYKPPVGMGVGQERFSNSEQASSDSTMHVEIEILTSAFYSRLVHYRNMKDAIRGEACCTDPRNQTVFASDANRLSGLLDQGDLGEMTEPAHMTGFDRLRWQLLRVLRCEPPAQSFTEAVESDLNTSKQLERQDYTRLDVYAARSPTNGELYRRSVTKLFLAQRYTGGSIGIVGIADLLIRLAFIISGIYATTEATRSHASVDVKLLMALSLLNAVHGWAFLKGITAPRRTDDSHDPHKAGATP